MYCVKCRNRKALKNSNYCSFCIDIVNGTIPRVNLPGPPPMLDSLIDPILRAVLFSKTKKAKGGNVARKNKGNKSSR
jgi:hypothetical protein